MVLADAVGNSFLVFIPKNQR